MVSKGSLATFEVETNWEEEPIPSSASMQQLKQKLKAGKRPKNAGWNESPTKGEIEIVIPNKKFKGSEKLQPPQAQMTPEVFIPYLRILQLHILIFKNYFFCRTLKQNRHLLVGTGE